jgi:hypothetical protein
VILCVEMRQQMIQNSNILNNDIMHLLTSFTSINVIEVRGHNNYNINKYGSSFKITLYILVIFYIEMGYRLFKTRITKYHFNVLVLTFNVIHVINIREHIDYNIMEHETSFKISLYFGDIIY